MKKGKFNLLTPENAWRVLGVFLILTLVFSAIAGLIITRGNKIVVKSITLDVRGAALTFEQYEPRNVDSEDSLPAIILFHGGSESLAATNMVAWELAKRGFVVLNASMYGCGNSEQPAITEDGFREENYFRGGSQGMYDIFEYCKNVSFIDNSRIGVWAHSAGALGSAAVVRMSGSYLTLNDRLFNILHDDYGMTFTAEDLEKDPEIFAKELSEADYAVYCEKKIAEEEAVEEYPQGARLSPGSNFNKTVTVAGVEVARDPQVNCMSGVGVHEDSGYLEAGTTEKYQLTFHTEDPQRNGWYYEPDISVDPDGEAQYIGQLFETTVANSPLLKKAIEENRARLYYSPETIHNGNLWDTAAVTKTCEFFCQVMNWNNGPIGAADSEPYDTKNCSGSYWTLAFTTLATISMIVSLIALAAIILETKFFKTAKFDCYVPTLSTKSSSFWIAIVFSVVAAFIGTLISSSGDRSFTISNATVTKWLPWEPGQIRTLTMVIVTAVVGAILFAILYFITKKKGGTLAKLSSVHLNCGVANAFKSILLSVILFAVFYIFAAIIKGLFGARFMSADNSWELMGPVGFMRTFKYAIILLPFTLILSTLNNMWSIKNVSDKVDTLINVIATSIGSELVVWIAILITFSTAGHGTVWDVHTILSVIVLAPIMSYIYRKMYKVTGSPWAGAALVALILGWRLASYISHQFIYYGPDQIKAFWGFY
jgi:predicted secreted protein